MPVVRIDALCECDGCQKRFGIELELTDDLKEYEDFQSIVLANVKGGNSGCYIWGVRGKQTVDRFPLTYHVTVQGNDMLLCDGCSKKCDDLPIDRNLTHAEVLDALGLPKEL